MRTRITKVALVVVLCATLVPISAGSAFARSIDEEFPASLADYGQVQPSIDYPYMVYKSETDSDSENTDIWAYNLETGRTFPICALPGEQSNPDVSGDKVVFSDDRNDPEGLIYNDCNIWMYDIATGEESVVCSETGGQGNPSIWGDIIAWTDGRADDGSGGDIYMYDLEAEEEIALETGAADCYEPTVWEGYVSWRSQVLSNGWYDMDAVVYDIEAGTSEVVGGGYFTDWSNYTRIQDPCLGDGVLVYSKESNTGGAGVSQSIHMYDLATSIETTVSTVNDDTDRWHPEVQDGWIVWQDRRNSDDYSGTEVFGYNMETGEEARLVDAVYDEDTAEYTKYAGRATTGDGWLAWHDHRDEGNNDAMDYSDLYVKWLGDDAAPTQAMPLQGPTRYETAVEVSAQSFPDGADSVVIATGENWPDALAGASFAGVVGAPILLVGDDMADLYAEELPEAVADEIERLGASDAYILGGEAAIDPLVQADVESIIGTEAVRFAGVDRYDTACVIADETVALLGDGWDGTAFATTGLNWPDALAAAPLSAYAGYPVFLAGPDGMSADTEACMDDLGVTGTIVLGGTVAMPLSVMSQMQSLGITEIDRVGGDTRYETAALISEYGVSELGMTFDTLGITTGAKFPDALSAGAALGQEGFTMMLTPGTYLHPTTAAALEANAADISQIRYAGGPNAVSAAVRTAVANCLY